MLSRLLRSLNCADILTLKMSAQPEPPIQFRPCAGLGNRLRALVSAVVWSEEIGLPLEVVWVPDGGIFNAPFESLFQRSSLPRHVCVRNVPSTAGRPGVETLLKQEADIPAYLATVGNRRPLRIKSYYRFHTSDEERWLQTLRALKPAPPIALAMEQQMAMLPSGVKAVGVHIRRTDHREAIARSTSDAFWLAMAAEPADTVFYIASDSEDERQAAAVRFPGRVLWFPCPAGHRSEPQDAMGALVELLCLSRCSKILGSSGSSFSEMAAAYGGVPLEVVRVAV